MFILLTSYIIFSCLSYFILELICRHTNCKEIIYMLQTFLVWQLIFSVFILRRKYSWNQIFGCMLVTSGVILAVTRYVFWSFVLKTGTVTLLDILNYCSSYTMIWFDVLLIFKAKIHLSGNISIDCH